ncbi:hypothetical protein LF1_37320 [Rubripirellula obstinata]|uniref:ZIP Zinc transporter n=1 Tax=Rubripirellula obstinata TaxID=406547 RepID=A0A5B1CJ44_9BACT|nr:hypothetical protein [Rubripirellula obstinata]KAA1261187.1 hypothetical protein LF1_37320 [Rubripirellula obstinata]
MWDSNFDDWSSNRLLTSAIATTLLVVVHASAGKLKFLNTRPRSRWLSLAGGVAVSYALLHLLPELAEYARAISEQFDRSGVTHVIYAIALAGLVVFYGIDWYAERSETSAEESSTLFWSHVAIFAAYNAITGYVLVREDRSLSQLSLYTIGIGLHFLVNDDALRRHYPDRYHRVGRWVLVLAVAAGWGLGTVTSVHDLLTAGLTAFLAGGILLNTFKEELPAQRESRFGSFVIGCVLYATVILIS